MPRTPLADQLLEELLETAQLAARTGGAVLLHWRGRFEITEKGPADLVTDADHASQHAIQRLLEERRPQDAFVGEESPRGASPPADTVCWVVDPLDGTTNYVHGFPCFATSVAAVIGGRVVAGAIYDPLRDELFSGAEGLGGTLNRERLRVSQRTQIAESLVAVSLPPEVSAGSPDLADFVWIAHRARAVRRTGSAALNLAYVAAGRLDAHWAHLIHPWDSAAGVLLVQEAGGVVTARHGGPYEVWQGNYAVAATQALHEELLAGLHKP
ncbi:inositol monophosphatase family protein [Botrimarina hoheduenensis]|uniref:Inositol-1-monophosphatase n=1 Tax=Botrimarina hoheduenensis TaxID=2528000 RepID=A0A5C5WAT0_9BACT|nr:inositol monophosphatase family protein [Botrimarina hoheduenensis]TWT47275.1 Inositol-1-monophosphatase [Botrimarina hoheduenensis]